MANMTVSLLQKVDYWKKYAAANPTIIICDPIHNEDHFAWFEKIASDRMYACITWTQFSWKVDEIPFDRYITFSGMVGEKKSQYPEYDLKNMIESDSFMMGFKVLQMIRGVRSRVAWAKIRASVAFLRLSLGASNTKRRRVA